MLKGDRHSDHTSARQRRKSKRHSNLMGFGFVGVGALYEDTLLSLPWFPKEDEKLRATALTSRVGGNIPNTLKVLSQVYSSSEDRLIFISAFAAKSASQRLTNELSEQGVQVAGVWRQCDQNPSSWILRSKESGSRTIVNYNAVEEITCDELVETISTLDCLEQINWIHFEGRIPDVLYAAIPQIRSIFPQATLSIEFEKPNRLGLMDLLPFTDVAFFSHSFFSTFQSELTDLHHPSAADCFFQEMRKRNGKSVFLVTVGNGGAMYCTTEGQDSAPTSRVEVVDATGAGDTFIAGFVWARGKLGRKMRQSVEMAVALATTKVAQEGFDRVWESLGGMETSHS